MDKKRVDIIASCFNEEENIFPFFDEVKKYIKDKQYDYNIVYVNDGSRDYTYDKITELMHKNKNVKVISFVRNFGHEAAMCAGIDMSKADYMIIMDVDLQNPPSKIPEILSAFEKKADCVLMRRVKYNSATLLKKFTSKAYYLFSKIVLRNKNEKDVSDFFAINKKLANVVKKKYRTTLRFVRSFIQAEAKKIAIINYENGERYFGDSRYNYLVLFKLALISELSRSQHMRDKYKETKENPIYIIDDKRTKYE